MLLLLRWIIIMAFLMLSIITNAQKQVVKDTIYVTKNPTNGNYFVTRITNYSDESSNVTKDVIGDSLTTTKAFLDVIEQESDKLAQAAIPIIMKASSDNVMRTYSKLFQEVSNRSIWSETNAKYGEALLGRWYLVRGDKVTPGTTTTVESELVFTPNKDKEYDVKTNVSFATLRNQIFLVIEDKQYDLFKIANNAYSTLDKQITFIKQ